MDKHLLVMFGGMSPEHEVSVITGLQVLENIDRSVYTPHVVYVSKLGELQYIENLTDRKNFLTAKRKTITIGKDSQGGYLLLPGLTSKKIYPYAAYLAFHGGQGEGGPFQGLFESFGIAYTSTSQESAVITMNKQLTKDQVTQSGVATIPGFSVLANEIREKTETIAQQAEQTLGLPVIVKPAHFGSSIGIIVAHTSVELQKHLLSTAFIDQEVVIEKFMTGFVEYNCSVRLVGGQLQTSEIERPVSKDEILSFADKYQRGGKKTGESGMASLHRELPAKISPELKHTIQEMAKKAFVACRCKGMVRIDFMQTPDNQLMLTEINSIPGSVAFYLWEATGVSFKQQITDLIEQSVVDRDEAKATTLDYQTDIIEKFIAN